MNLLTRRDLLQRAGGIAAAACAPSVIAQAGPNLDLARIVIGFAPGGATDVIARRLADGLTGQYAKTVIVENKPGAATRLASETVKRAPSDGTYFLVAPAGVMFLFPHIYDKLSYDPFKDFVPVTRMGITTFALAVGPAVPPSVTNIPQFIDWCRMNPGSASCGVTAAGSVPHFMIEELKRQQKFDLTIIPYRGAAPGIQDLVGGQVAGMISTIGDFLPFLESGKARILSTSGRERSPYLRGTATLVEQGYRDLVVTEEYPVVFLPAGTPRTVVDKLAAEVGKVMQKPEMRQTMEKFGIDISTSSPEDLMHSIREEYERWGPVVKATGFKAE